MTGASYGRETRLLLRGVTARLQGKAERGPDRRVRRESYDVDDARAKPWARIGDGSIGEGLAHREALLQSAGELRRQQWTELPNAKVREARERHATLSAELDGYVAAGDAPIGRPAVVRQELARLADTLKRAGQRLQRVDLAVLEALLKHVDFATGRLFPTLDRIAQVAVCHRNAVVTALRRLKHHGFVSWVRRSVKTDNEGAFAPQREQTSNAYYFEHRARMAAATFSRFLQVLTYKLRRLGAKRPPDPGRPAEVTDPELRATLARLGAGVARNAST